MPVGETENISQCIRDDALNMKQGVGGGKAARLSGSAGDDQLLVRRLIEKITV